MAKPLCEYYGKCGGCNLQHLETEIQLKQKAELIRHVINFEDIQVFSGEGYGYRNRQDFFFRRNGIGLREKGHASEILVVDKCPIAQPEVNKILMELNLHFKDNDNYSLRSGQGTFISAIVRAAAEGNGVCFVLNDNSPRLKEAVEKIEEYARGSQAGNIAVFYVDPNNKDFREPNDENFFVAKGNEYLAQNYLGRKFCYPIEGFFQNNHQMAEQMQKYCNEKLAAYGTSMTSKAALLDLYGGVGTFGIINSSLFRKVTIIDFSSRSIACAEKNIEENAVKNAKAIAMDLRSLKKLTVSGPLFAITDPPRSGMDIRALDSLNELKPEAIIYISCNPLQLGKELPRLKNYSVKSAAMFDMFPQTNHAEAIVELGLKN
ncbi:class I SAM-dependent RNA methyltransferase [Candidatus Woesearchaeota archaeon]|nr:class I SAM-dependent RNA methyltransferase [Candidatus Woesearchaeota archaeon]